MPRTTRADKLITLWRFSADQYQRMGETGIFQEDDPVELIDGVVVQTPPIGPKHNAAVDRCRRQFTRQVGDGAIVRVQGSIRLSGTSEPQPDLTILRNRDDFYAGSLPGPDDVLLLIEVAQSSPATTVRSSFRFTPGKASPRSGS